MFKLLVTDLDGTLLDYDYSYDKSLEAVKKLKRAGIPIIFCTSKTFTENLYYRKKLGIRDPFIVENGSAIFIPKKYFNKKFQYSKEIKDFYVVELGTSYEYIYSVLKQLQPRYGFITFGELSIKELSRVTGLSTKLARLAKQKQYNESIFFENFEEKRFRELRKELSKKGLRLVKGSRFLNVFGKTTNKGLAVKTLLSMYRQQYGRITSYGIGDGYNDLPMLRTVTHGFLLLGKAKKFARCNNKKIKRIKKQNGEGFSYVVNNFILK